MEGVADFNRDGQMDLLWRDRTTGQNAIWQMNGTSLATAIGLPTVVGTSWEIEDVADFNNDGQMDLLWRNYGSGQNVVWQMNGATLASAIALTLIDNLPWTIEGTGDFNNDGQTDILWRHYTSGQNVIWQMSGTSLVTATHLPIVTDTNWQLIASASRFGTPPVLDGAGNTPETAFHLGTLRGSGMYLDAVSLADPDYFRFSLISRSQVNLSLTGLSSGNFELSGNGMAVLQGVGSATRAIETVLNPGTYAIRVYQSVSSPTWYSLQVLGTPTAPVISARLLNDTGFGSGANTDRLTADPTITGQVSNERVIRRLLARLNPTTGFTALTTLIQSDGMFKITPTQLQSVQGQPLADGTYTVEVQVEDGYGLVSSTTLAFTLDTTVAAPTLQLLESSDSGQSATDRITQDTTPTLTGTAEVGADIILYHGTQVLGTARAKDGTWQMTLPELSQGTYHLTAKAIDRAGNVSVNSAPLAIAIDTTAPTLTLLGVAENGTLFANSRLVGHASGTGSAITSLTYRFGTLPEVPVSVAADGTFDAVINFTGVSNGVQTLTLTSVDQAGNVHTQSFNLTVNLGISAPTAFTIALANDTGNHTDGITTDPTIAGTFVRAENPSPLQVWASFDGLIFTNITNLMGTGTQFSLNRAALETIYTGPLVDGFYTLRLQVRDEAGTVLSAASTAFTCDTTAPELNLTGLMDGITWNGG